VTIGLLFHVAVNPASTGRTTLVMTKGLVGDNQRSSPNSTFAVFGAVERGFSRLRWFRAVAGLPGK
jgi:hypothetical protein